MTTYLDRILASHRSRAALDKRDLARLERLARQAPPARGFVRAIRSEHDLAVIAEIKRASPSRGRIDLGLDPASVAVEYEGGGAACLSVLTDAQYFQGSDRDLEQARAVVALPVLRKDFTVCLADVFDTRAMGADAILLIVAALSPAELDELLSASADTGLDAMVEVHDEAEVGAALDAGAALIGVNQRDLQTFDVDTDRATRVGRIIPPTVTKVAESGITGPADLEPLLEAGFDGVLVGESLILAGDRVGSVRRLREAGVGA